MLSYLELLIAMNINSEEDRSGLGGACRSQAAAPRRWPQIPVNDMCVYIYIYIYIYIYTSMYIYI